MKPCAILAIALLSWESASLALPAVNPEPAFGKTLPLSGGSDLLSPDLVSPGPHEKHMEKRGTWKNWSPSGRCVGCISNCVQATLNQRFAFTYRVTPIPTNIAPTFTYCGMTCVYEAKCHDKLRSESDPFLKQSEAGRIMSQYNENGMISGAGQSTPANSLPGSRTRISKK